MTEETMVHCATCHDEKTFCPDHSDGCPECLRQGATWGRRVEPTPPETEGNGASASGHPTEPAATAAVGEIAAEGHAPPNTGLCQGCQSPVPHPSIFENDGVPVHKRKERTPHGPNVIFCGPVFRTWDYLVSYTWTAYAGGQKIAGGADDAVPSASWPIDTFAQVQNLKRNLAGHVQKTAGLPQPRDPQTGAPLVVPISIKVVLLSMTLIRAT